MFERIILVTRKTRYDELIERFNTRSQAKFYIEHAGGNFADYEEEYRRYQLARDQVNKQLDVGLKLHTVDRALVPSLLFTEKDCVVALGQDGLIANTAKYVGAQPVIGVNPDSERFDGILAPFSPQQLGIALRAVLDSSAMIRSVTLGEAVLEDGQRLLAFNDLFIGAASHVSARYRISFGSIEETHSSSGVIISTGAGSTGWLSSVFNMAGGLAKAFGGDAPEAIRLPWEDSRLIFSVREPFRSKHSSDTVVAGVIEQGADLVIESLMPTGGVIFSDGVERDFLTFGSGATARIRAAVVQAQIVIPK